MKFSKVFYTFVFFLILPFSVWAQGYSYPNELNGFEFFRKGKWKSLVPYFSTREDVRKVFGSDCSKRCSYDKNWKIRVGYIHQSWRSPSFEPCVAPEVLGKMERLFFYPKNPLSLKDAVFSESFQSETLWISHDISPVTAYFDSEGLGYMLLASEYGEYWKRQGQTSIKDRSNELLYIYYGISEKEGRKLKDKLRCFDYNHDTSYPGY